MIYLEKVPVAVGNVANGKLGGRINISGYALHNYKMLDPNGYTIMCETGKFCETLRFLPNTKLIVLEGNSQTHLLYNPFPNVINNIAQELDVTPEAARALSQDFFTDKTIIVQPVGLQGRAYNTMRQIQNYAPVASMYNAVTAAKATGITGLQIVSRGPLTFVGGGLVCAYFGAVAGNNTLGTVFNVSSYILTRPMWGVEVTLNGLILEPLSNVTGLPLVLNGTNEIIYGKGMNILDYGKIGLAFERISNVTLKNVNRAKKVYDAAKKAF